MRTLVTHDWHLPFVHAAAFKRMLQWCRREKPERIILAGDIFDCHALSQHRRNSQWLDNLEKEIDQSWPWLEQLMEANPKALVEAFPGNHEARFSSYYLNRAPALRTVGVDWDGAYGLDELGIRVVKPGMRVPAGQGQKVTVFHGHEGKWGLSKFAGATALRAALERGHHVHFGHTHKLGMLYGLTAGKLVYGVEGGYLGDIRKPAFEFVGAKKPPWALGFSVYDSEKQINCHPEFVRC